MIQSDNHPKHQTVTKTNGETSGQQGSLIRILDLDGMRLELLMDQDHWLGIGQVQTASGISLRSAEMPMTVELRSPDGVRLVNWRLSGISPRQAGGLDLELVCDRIDDGPMEFMLHTVRSRYRVGNGKRETVPAVGTKLILSLWPVQRKLGERVCKGFGYQYQYQSADIAQYKLLDLSTWEPGGSVTGSELWLRGAQPTVTRFNNVADSYSSEWYLPGISNPNVFQFKPLQTHLQGFTFTAGRQGILITWATQVHHVRTLIQKNPGQDLLMHLHEHCADLGLTLSSAPMEVLFWEQAGLEDVDRANCHEAMRELVYAQLHQQAGMRMERIGPTGMIEEWGPPDMKRYREEGLPALLEAGAKTIEIANFFQNNMNVYGLSNMCCTLDWKIAEVVGEQALHVFCQTASQGGAKVRMWGNTALSTLGSHFFDPPITGIPHPVQLYPPRDSEAYKLFRQADALVRDPSGSVEADHYRPRFAVVNLRHPGVRQYWLDCWKHAHDAIGLSGIFLDSSFNLSSDKFHYRQAPSQSAAHTVTADQADLLVFTRPHPEPAAAIESMYLAHLSLMAQMQRQGYGYCGEDHGVFGVHRAGWNLRADLKCLHLWSDCYQHFDIPMLEKEGLDPDDVYFRGLAYRIMWLIHWIPKVGKLSFTQGEYRGEFDTPQAWHLQMIKLYGKVEPWLYKRTILPDETGVIYQHNGVTIVWSFVQQTLELEPGEHQAEELVSGKTQKVQGTLELEGRQVVMLRPLPVEVKSTDLPPVIRVTNSLPPHPGKTLRVPGKPA